jgi:hypothetical protein
LVIAKKMGLSTLDFVQVYEHGIAINAIEKQLATFKGVPKIKANCQQLLVVVF